MADKNLKLRFLCLITRHGERAPLFFLPNDPNIGHWPEGLGSLTKRGKIEMYDLGRTLRKRYDDFLGDKPFSRDVYVRSTDKDRCLASAQCCLAGLYPPVDDEDKLTPEINWQPVPIHTVPEAIDPFTIRFPVEKPLRQDGSYEEPLHNQIYQRIIRKHKELWDYVDQISNAKGDFNKICFLLGTFDSEAQKNLSVPKFLQENKADLHDLCTQLTTFYGANISSAGASARYFLDEIVNKMESFMEKSSSTPKTFIYCIHDFNLLPLVEIVSKQLMDCPTASCLIFELHEDVDASNEFYVKIRFLQEHNKAPIEIKFLGGRSNIVGFVEFKTFVRNSANETNVNMNENIAIKEFIRF